MLNRALEEALDDIGQASSNVNNNGSFAVVASPLTPANNSSMSMESTLSSVKYNQGHNSMLATASKRSFFSPGYDGDDVDMSMT